MIKSTHELDVIRQKNETIRRYEKALRLAADMYGKSAANCGTCPMGDYSLISSAYRAATGKGARLLWWSTGRRRRKMATYLLGERCKKRIIDATVKARDAKQYDIARELTIALNEVDAVIKTARGICVIMKC